MRSIRFERWTWNPVVWLVAAGCLLSVGVVVAGPHRDAGGTSVESFLGLWQGVDPLDGSPVRLSLSDIDDDGVLEHTLQEDFLTACFQLGPTYSRGRGVVTGTATVAGNGVLDVTTELVCLDDFNVPRSLGVAPNQYTLRSRNRVLVLPPFGNAPAMVLHRVAQ